MGVIQKIMYAIEGKDKAYVSDADRLLAKFDQEHPERSASQLHEIKKHQGIFSRVGSVFRF